MILIFLDGSMQSVEKFCLNDAKTINYSHKKLHCQMMLGWCHQSIKTKEKKLCFSKKLYFLLAFDKEIDLYYHHSINFDMNQI